MVDALRLEVKKDGFQQLQSGSYKLTVTLNPSDLKDNAESLLLDFIKAPMGQIYMLGMCEVTDSGQPVEKPKRKPAETRAELARRLCGVFEFRDWIAHNHSGGIVGPTSYKFTSDRVKAYCGVASKNDLDILIGPKEKWDALYTEFQQSTGRMAERIGG